jgi:hypothetical protein
MTRLITHPTNTHLADSTGSSLTRLAIGLAIVAALLAALTALLVPAAARSPVSPGFDVAWPVVRGAFHVHSSRSDGTGTLEHIAAAAARAGLQFVIVTDHGDGTRPPEPPAYRSGVLCIDAVEISTERGHYVALNLGQAPYPLAGHSSDVIEDVRRLGGFGFAAHPGSAKDQLRWGAWDAPFDGIEWLNADSEWRDERWASLGRSLLTYAFRPVETLGRLMDRPVDVLQHWDRLTTSRRVAAVAAIDAHARLGWRASTDPYEDRVLARVPSYEVAFRAFVSHVVLDKPLSREATTDADLIMSAIGEGRMFTSMDSLAGLSAFETRAMSGGAIARPGEYLDVTAPVVIDAQIAAPTGTTLSVIRNGETLHEVVGPTLRLDVGTQAGAYRIEAYLPTQTSGKSVPWVLSNPFYVGLRDTHARASSPTPTGRPASERSPIVTTSWGAEAGQGSSSTLQPGVLDDGTPALEWRFALAGGPRGQQYAAMRFPVDGSLASHGRLQLRARSDGPRRLWAQLRAPVPGDRHAEGERWGQTFYLDEGLTAVELRFDQFRALGPVSSPLPVLGRIDSLLLVVDTLNSVPGATGRVWITDLWLVKN